MLEEDSGLAELDSVEHHAVDDPKVEVIVALNPSTYLSCDGGDEQLAFERRDRPAARKRLDGSIVRLFSGKSCTPLTSEA